MKHLKKDLTKELLTFSKRKSNLKKESKLLKRIKDKKAELVNKNLQMEAKELWVLETLYITQNIYIKFTSQIRKEKYYEAWCSLERCEINILNLKKHINEIHIKQFYFDFLSHQVPLWQDIYPYKIFASSEFLEKKIKCSTCNTIMTPRSSCNHVVGEIYDGELSYRIIEEVDILGVAMVKNPVQKMCVPFKTDAEGNQFDHYNYECLKMIYSSFPNLFYWWEINNTIDLKPRKTFSDFEATDLCPCGSELQFSICCSSKEMIATPHKEIIRLKRM